MSESLTQSRPISVMMVDDHQVLTDALTTILHSQPDLQVVGAVDSCAAARERLGRTCPDVLLLDVGLPDGDGLSLVPEINRLCPHTQILILTGLLDEKTLTRAMESGANGFVGKNRPLSEVFSAVRQAAEGEIVMPTSLLLALAGRAGRAKGERPPEGRNPLSPREREILACLASGQSGAAIAAQLNISLPTVRTHIRDLMEKLGVHSRLAAVSHALRHGLMEPPV